jgi:hypothetical protein
MTALFPAPAPTPPATAPTRRRWTAADCDLIAEAVVDLIKTAVGPLVQRIVQLEQQPPSPRYEGIFEQGKAYARGSLVTRSGGLWLAVDHTTRSARPHGRLAPRRQER